MKTPKTSTSLIIALGMQGQGARWKEFIDRYKPMMEGYLHSKFFNIEYEDVIQDTFIALAKALPNYRYAPDESGAFHDYIVAILRNKACDALRVKEREENIKKEYSESLSYINGEIKEEDLVNQAILKIALRDMLDDSSILMRNKRIFIENAINGISPDDVAEMFGITRNNVDQIKSRMIKRLQEKCKELKGAIYESR